MFLCSSELVSLAWYQVSMKKLSRRYPVVIPFCKSVLHSRRTTLHKPTSLYFTSQTVLLCGIGHWPEMCSNSSGIRDIFRFAFSNNIQMYIRPPQISTHKSALDFFLNVWRVSNFYFFKLFLKMLWEFNLYMATVLRQ